MSSDMTLLLDAFLQKKSAKKWLKNAVVSNYARGAACAALVLASFALAALLFGTLGPLQGVPKVFTELTLHEYAFAREEPLPLSNSSKFMAHRSQCTHHSCLDIYRCGHDDRLKVYIYPPSRYVDSEGIPISAQPSKEYYQILEAIYKSRFYEADPNKACILVPSIDTLNQNRFRPQETSQVLSLLPYWNGDGENHLIFNMVPGSAPDFSSVVELALGKAILAGAGFDSWTYQPGFDVSIPLFSPSALTGPVDTSSDRPWLLLSTQINIHQEYLNQLEAISTQDPSKFLALKSCGESAPNVTQRCSGDNVYQHPEILHRAHFCAVIRGARLAQPALLEAMSAGCIPVVVADSIVMPFQVINFAGEN